MVFFNYLNFLSICLEFSITHRVGTERNRTIIFISVSHLFPTYFGLKWIHNGIFLIVWIFLLFFWNFLLRIEQERNGTIISIFSLSQPFSTYFGLKWSNNSFFFNFLNFFTIFTVFSITLRVGTKQNYKFYFLRFSSFSNQFWLEMN